MTRDNSPKSYPPMRTESIYHQTRSKESALQSSIIPFSTHTTSNLFFAYTAPRTTQLPFANTVQCSTIISHYSLATLYSSSPFPYLSSLLLTFLCFLNSTQNPTKRQTAQHTTPFSIYKSYPNQCGPFSSILELSLFFPHSVFYFLHLASSFLTLVFIFSVILYCTVT